MSTVYAVTECKPYQSMEDANEFGTIKILFPTQTFPRSPWKQVIKDPEVMYEHARQALAEFNPAEDYFLPIGDMTLVTLCASIVGAMAKGLTYNLLVWNPRRNYYEAVTVNP